MRHRSPIILRWGLLILGCALVAAPVCGDEVDDFVRATMEKHKTPGIAIAVIRDGEPARVQGYGLANIELEVPVTPDTIFQSGSVAKQFTAAGILLLAGDGKLTLDDPAGRFLPADSFHNPWAASQPLRLLHLLELSGGFSDLSGVEFNLNKPLSLADALALNPSFIVADEPVSALDVSVQSQVLNVIARLQHEHGISFLFISHDLAVIQHVSDDVGVMYLGRLVEFASSVDLYREPKHPYTRALMSAIPVPDVKRKSKRIVLGGDVPSPMKPPGGCPFHPRCPEATAQCKEVVPPKVNTGTADEPHFVRCHLY